MQIWVVIIFRGLRWKMNGIHLSARSLVSDHWYQRHAEKANDLGNNPRQVFVERALLVAGALSIECKQSEQSIGVVAMVDAVLTHQNIPTGYRLLPTADTPSFLRDLSLSLSRWSPDSIWYLEPPPSTLYHSLSLALFLPAHALCPFLLSHHGPSVRSVRVIPGSNSSQSHAIIFKTSKPIRKSSYAAAETNELARRVEVLDRTFEKRSYHN